MSVILLDPRFPAMIPVEAVAHLRGDVSYTEEVPVRVRWVIADLGGHTVAESDVLVTTDIANELVRRRLQGGDELIKAPSLVVEMEPNKQLEASSSASGDTTGETGIGATPQAPSRTGVTRNATMPSPLATANGAASGGVASAHTSSSDATEVTESGAGFVDGEIVGTDEHTVAVAGLRRTTRTEVPASVMDEMEDAVALMARALRQGEWEQGMTHVSLMDFLRQETAELARVVEALDEYSRKHKGEKAPEWLEQELCQELSDVLLQVLFHAEIANRRGAFDIGHVSGAFVAKMRSRAPYLFEQIERDVPRTEQDRLWEEGKRKERAAKLERLGKPYQDFVGGKDNPAQQQGKDSDKKDSFAGEPGAAKKADIAGSTQVGKPSDAQPASVEGAPVSHAPVQTPRKNSGKVSSALVEAENVIRRARDMGLPDGKIPTDIRYPMVGLELDEPGEADRRLLDAVRAFHQHLDDYGREQ